MLLFAHSGNVGVNQREISDPGGNPEKLPLTQKSSELRSIFGERATEMALSVQRKKSESYQ